MLIHQRPVVACLVPACVLLCLCGFGCGCGGVGVGVGGVGVCVCDVVVGVVVGVGVGCGCGLCVWVWVWVTVCVWVHINLYHVRGDIVIRRNSSIPQQELDEDFSGCSTIPTFNVFALQATKHFAGT